MHHGVQPRMDDLLWTKRSWNGSSAYADSKLCDVLLAFAVARRSRNVLSNALEPGWVPTKMGGPSVPGDMSKAHVTQAWLAVSDDPLARSNGDISTTSSFARRTRSRAMLRSRTSSSPNAPGYPESHCLSEGSQGLRLNRVSRTRPQRNQNFEPPSGVIRCDSTD